MTDKFTIEDLMIRIMPGGFLLAIIFFVFHDKIQINFIDSLDFFYTFMFFCSAFIVGEFLQTIAHETEWFIDIFFKFRRPSEIFLYKNNPVLKSAHKRKEAIEKLNLSDEELKIFDKEYSELSVLWWKKEKKNDEISQSLFWRLYSQVSGSEEIKISNSNYLFTRVIMLEFLLISILLYNKNFTLSILSMIILLVFLWRSRGVARGLVFKTVLLNLK
ncbi:hypothetical protein KKA77_00025 [Patescibacteria group bacterium]|nr:hypothetical protein [Patescibacteria group bacterium]MBU2081463.1 hypothetical protein [Patescibacteria group bacterium]MBU2249991.1 hypothetical protein [Patescibacteria group bacterium]